MLEIAAAKTWFESRRQQRHRFPCRGAKVTIPLVMALLVACESPTTNSVSYREVLVPPLQGKLHRSGVAQSGVVLRVSRNEGVRSVCERPVREGITNELGEFQLEAITREQIPAVPDRLENNWQVCMVQNDRIRQIWFDRHVGVMTGEQRKELDCDLDDADGSRRAFCTATVFDERAL